MNTRELLDFIGSVEAPRGYNQMEARAEQALGKHNLTGMTFNEIDALQAKMTKVKGASSACGRYQFIRRTLKLLRTVMKINGNELFNAEYQDLMALKLCSLRGIDEYIEGIMSTEDFANNLAREWASLPVVTPMKGHKRMVKPGESYYAEVLGNAALHPVNSYMAIIGRIKQQAPPKLTIVDTTIKPPLDVAEKPRENVFAKAVNWLKSLVHW